MKTQLERIACVVALSEYVNDIIGRAVGRQLPMSEASKQYAVPIRNSNTASARSGRKMPNNLNRPTLVFIAQQA